MGFVLHRPTHPVRLSFYILIVALAIPFIYFLTVREMRFFLVPSKSMEPTLVPPEYIVTWNAGEYRRGDIVVLEDPEDAGGYLVKRLVAVGGDVIAITGGALYINGTYASEPYLVEPAEYFMPEYVVPTGEVVVIGDNRNWSVDSHNWVHRSVSLRSIVGRVRFVYLPFDRMRKVQSYRLTSLDEI